MERIILGNLSKKYRKQSVLNAFSYRFEDKVYAIIGSNGVGKSTLLKCILSLIRYSGSIRVCSLLPIAYLPEFVSVPPYVSVLQFLDTFLNVSENEVEKLRINESLNKWQIQDAKNKKLHTLSKGMLQKVLLLLVLHTKSDIYLFDEPLSGLDQVAQALFKDELLALKKQNKCIILSTHYVLYYQELIDQVLLYEEGKFYEANI